MVFVPLSAPPERPGEDLPQPRGEEEAPSCYTEDSEIIDSREAITVS